ncbi:DNRLRE domain-containing protein [Polyangium sp. 15x6]|uniref:DNRLRE domain-containing protein n=1 Tax=Polyangium sp. 15x6 TaxID=3042687 RepID=UPI00249A33C5|nr:DNRLRE domain-containing protein [Polyangium sp. 15x6]MDI3283553.1 DNRLRE domain-containing protein [Polyangium sp. 15x6]
MWIARPPFAVLLAASLLGCVQSPPGPPLCAADVPCAAEGDACVVGRCRPKKDTLVTAMDARRLLLFPDAVAVVSSKGPSGGGEALPEAVSLGRSAAGDTSLLLHFEVPVAEVGEVSSAFLVLETATASEPPTQPVSLSIARILEPWRADFVSWGRSPRLDVAEKAGTVGVTSPSPMRIDVTHVVQRWAKRTGEEHGLAVLADPNDPRGITFSLGVVEKRGPRLEVYAR